MVGASGQRSGWLMSAGEPEAELAGLPDGPFVPGSHGDVAEGEPAAIPSCEPEAPVMGIASITKALGRGADKVQRNRGGGHRETCLSGHRGSRLTEVRDQCAAAARAVLAACQAARRHTDIASAQVPP